MAQLRHNTNLTKLLLKCMAQSDPMLSMLEWLCKELMETELSHSIVTNKSEQSDTRRGYRCDYRARRLDFLRYSLAFLFERKRTGASLFLPFL